MERAAELEVLSPKVNRVVVRTPGRRYAGIVVQGDRLGAWVTAARTACSETRGGRAAGHRGPLRRRDGRLRETCQPRRDEFRWPV